MLARAALGQGFRSVAAASGVPEDRVRDGLRRFRGSAAGVREFFTRLAGALAVGPGAAGPGGQRAGRRGGGGRGCRGGGRRPVAGARGVAVGARGRGGGWVAAVPGCRFPGGSRGRARVCPGVTVQRGCPSGPGRLLPVTLGGPARGGVVVVTRRRARRQRRAEET